MLLSKRRLRWAAVALLFACGLLLTQPTRLWLQRIWIAATLGPQVTVGQIIYHGQSSIIEVHDLAWHAALEAEPESRGRPTASSPINQFSVNARRGWLGIDQKRLADGLIHLPKVILQDTVVTLTSSLPEHNTGLDEWQHGVVRHLEQFDWKNLELGVSCLTAVEELETACSLHAKHLIERSGSNLTEAGRIEEEAAAMDNPLRFEESIRARLTRLKELSVEQRLLLAQLSTMQGELADDTERLEELHEQELQAIERVCVGLQNATTSERQDFALDQHLALAIAQAGWEQVAAYGEVVANTSQAAAAFRAANYDLTVRPGARGKDHIHCSDLKASGEFRCAQVSSTFQTNGSWRLAQQSPGDVFRELSSLTSFDCQTNQVEVSASHDSRKSPGIQLRLRMISQGAAAGSRTALAAGRPHTNSLAPVTASLNSDSGTLSGTLSVAANALPHLSQKLPQDLLDSMQQSILDGPDEGPHEPLQFELSGTWKQPKMKHSGATPDWLQRAVEMMLNQQSQLVIAQSQRKLGTEFNRRIEKARERVTLATRDAHAVIARGESELLTRQQRLQQRFDEMHGTEFARRVDEVQR